MGDSSAKQISTLTGGQENILKLLEQGGASAFPQGLEAILSQLDPEKINALFQQGVGDPARENFQNQTIPSILQSATNAGAKGGSTLERMLAQSGRGLEKDLSAQSAQFQAGQQQSGIANLMEMLGLGLGRDAVAIQPGQPGWGKTLGAAAAGGAGQAVKMRYGG